MFINNKKVLEGENYFLLLSQKRKTCYSRYQGETLLNNLFLLTERQILFSWEIKGDILNLDLKKT